MVNRHTPESRQLSKMREQLTSGMTRSKNPRPLTADEITELKRMCDVVVAKRKANVVSRIVGAVEASTSAVNANTDRVVAASTAEIKRSLVETFCPEVAPNASANEKLNALKARHHADRCVMAKLRKERVDERQAEKEAKKAADALVGKKPRAKAKAKGLKRDAPAAAEAPELAVVEPPEPTEPRAKRLCGAACIGAKKGKTETPKLCKKPFPCKFHKEIVKPMVESVAPVESAAAEEPVESVALVGAAVEEPVESTHLVGPEEPESSSGPSSPRSTDSAPTRVEKLAHIEAKAAEDASTVALEDVDMDAFLKELSDVGSD